MLDSLPDEVYPEWYGEESWKPTFQHFPTGGVSLCRADEAKAIAAWCGINPDKFQDHTLDVWMGERDGKWAAPLVGMALARQNGKTISALMLALWGLLHPVYRHVQKYGSLPTEDQPIETTGYSTLWTAHELDTAMGTFRLFRAWVFGDRAPNSSGEPDPDAPHGGFFNLLTTEIMRGNNSPRIVLKPEYGGGEIWFSTRGLRSKRGRSFDILIMDEALHLSQEILASVSPTVSAGPKGDSLKVMVSSPPTPVTDGEAFDLDASAVVVGADGKALADVYFVFYNNPKDPSGAVTHHGDNRTGAGDGDDETITVELASLPENAHRVVFLASIDQAVERRQTFGQVSDAYIRVYDVDNPTDAATEVRFDLGEDASTETALIFGELYRHGAEWKFRAVGQGYTSGLAGVLTDFGLLAG